jgi:hypothetical protein
LENSDFLKDGEEELWSSMVAWKVVGLALATGQGEVLSVLDWDPDVLKASAWMIGSL